MTTEAVIDWCGFAGAWLLVAGPLYQAVLELQEEDAANAGDSPTSNRVAPPPRPSPWWWLLPPVMIILRRRRSRRYHRTVLASLPATQRARRRRFLEKATGWLTVASGGSFIAVKETFEVAEHFEWPTAVTVRRGRGHVRCRRCCHRCASPATRPSRR